MTARDEFLRGLEAAGGWADGDPEEWWLAEPDDVPRTHPTCTPEEAS